MNYSVPYSGFFFISGIQLSLIDTSWTPVVSNNLGLLCLDNAKDISSDITFIAIGKNLENSDGLHCSIDLRNAKVSISFESDVLCGVPVFWLSRNGVVIVASNIELLITLANNLGIRLKTNLGAFSEMLISGYIYSEPQTGVEDIQLLPPKSRLSIHSSGRTLVERTAPEFNYQNETLPWKGAKDAFKDNLINGLRKYNNQKVACLLSGGADSRLMALSALKSGISVDFLTFGQSTVNVSDFYVANQIGYKVNKKVKCFSTSAAIFKERWKIACSQANWINDSVWWAGRLPEEMFGEMGKYDVILRGDGDGIYGWKSAVANVSDILHRLEISEISAVKRFGKYFTDPAMVFGPAEKSRNELVNKYRNSSMRLQDLTNILYQKIREPRGIAPGTWQFSRIVPVDAPLLWARSLHIAERLPVNKRRNKRIIFEVLNDYPETSNIPFSNTGSWDNQLEFYFSGVWEELIDYIKRHSPFSLEYDRLYRDFVKPSAVRDTQLSTMATMMKSVKISLLGNKLGRKIAFRWFAGYSHSGMSERLIIRLALISNICELINKPPSKGIVKPDA